ncbi:MAG TPA: hypothetical protein P5048_01235 [Chlamydiales bacterium]|nr:hypothetical protein [Chlamydiales bacterium]
MLKLKNNTKTILYFAVFLLAIAFSKDISAKESKHDLIPSIENPQDSSQSYSINFNNVAINEYIRFVGKICDLNFLFSENDLNFFITINSDEPLQKKDLISTLVQILRIHGFSLLEEGNNLVIHKNPDVKQIAKISSEGENVNPETPLITKIFKIKNISLARISEILRAMISTNAQLETIDQTRQLIVTDTSANIIKINELIQNLDTDINPLELKIFTTLHNNPQNLVVLIQKILEPIISKQPYTLIPQESTGKIFIVSTPFLIERTESLIDEIDIEQIKLKKNVATEEIFIYQPKHLTHDQLEKILQSMEENLATSGYPDNALLETLKDFYWVGDKHSFLFTGTAQTLEKLKTILLSIDTPSDGKKIIAQNTQFYVYTPLHRSGEELKKAIDEMQRSLEESGLENSQFIKTLQSAKWSPATKTIIFTGNNDSIERIKNLLTAIDVQEKTVQKEEIQTTYYLYRLKNVSGEIIEEDLENFASKLKSQKIQKKDLLDALESIRWIEETNALMITGTPKAIEELKIIISEYDIPRTDKTISKKDNFIIYKPKYVSAETIENSLKDTAKNLKDADLADPHFLNAIASMKYVESTNSLVFTGDQETLQKISGLIDHIDVKGSETSIIHKGKKTYLLYNIQAASSKKIIASIKAITQDLIRSKTGDEDFIEALQSMKYQGENHALLFTGKTEALEKVQKLIIRFDISDEEKTQGPSSFFIYKPLNLSGPALETILKDFVDHLENAGLDNKPLTQAINSARWIEKTNSLIFTGTQETLSEVKGLLASFDTTSESPLETPDSIQPIDDTSFLVYKLQYHKGDEIQVALRQIAKDVDKVGGKMNEKLYIAINSIQWIQITNSLVCSGDQGTLSKLKDLIKSLDIPLKQVFIEMLVLETGINNLLDFGLDWGSKFKYKNKLAASTGSFRDLRDSDGNNVNYFEQNFAKVGDSVAPDPANIPFEQGGFDLGVIGDLLFHKGKSFVSLGSLISALQTDSESSIVTTPKIITQDNKKSSIFIGSNVPYIGSQTSNSSANVVTAYNLEYRDIGVKLDLTPVLGNSDTVSLTIDMEQSRVDSSSQLSSAFPVQGITTQKTSMQTSVHIPNKHFLVLSGMVIDQKERNKTGVPCLGGLPLVGAAFSENKKQDARRNIVIFIRPHIINSYEDMVAITENQEDFFRQEAGTPTLEKEFDENVELLKSPSDE